MFDLGKTDKKVNSSKKRLLAVSSAGGHWIELMRLLPAIQSNDLAFVTVNQGYASEIKPLPGARFYCIGDVTRWNKVKWILTAFQLLLILLKERPHFVLSTGALPGYMAVRLGKMFGAKTIWVDSIANVEELSKSGQSIGRHADLWLTQWEHLSRKGGPHFHGTVL